MVLLYLRIQLLFNSTANTNALLYLVQQIQMSILWPIQMSKF